MIRNDVLNAMSTQYGELTKSAKKVADYIFDNSIETQYLSITSLAEECNVAEATIFRFCRTLGFKGYNDFKLALAKSSGRSTWDIDSESPQPERTGKITSEDTVLEMSRKLCNIHQEALHQTMALINEKNIICAAQALLQSNRVLCVGQGASLIMAMEMAVRFLTVSPSFMFIEDSHLQAMTASLLTKNDAVVLFSYSGSTKDMLDVLQPAKEMGAKIIVITRFAKSPATALADIVLLCGSKEGPLQPGSVAAKIAQLFVVDVLFNEYCRQSPETAEKNRELTSNSTAKKLL